MAESQAMADSPTTQDWDSILRFYSELGRGGSCELAALVRELVARGYPSAGLQALTSVHDLLLGPSADVTSNPFLRVAYDPEGRRFVLTYESGFDRPSLEAVWQRTASPEEVADVVERFLTKRARWFRSPDRASARRSHHSQVEDGSD